MGPQLLGVPPPLNPCRWRLRDGTFRTAERAAQIPELGEVRQWQPLQHTILLGAEFCVASRFHIWARRGSLVANFFSLVSVFGLVACAWRGGFSALRGAGLSAGG